MLNKRQSPNPIIHKTSQQYDNSVDVLKLRDVLLGVSCRLGTRRALMLFSDVPLTTRRAIMLFSDVPLRTRRALSPQALYGNSTLLALSGISLNVIMPFWLSTDKLFLKHFLLDFVYFQNTSIVRISCQDIQVMQIQAFRLKWLKWMQYILKNRHEVYMMNWRWTIVYSKIMNKSLVIIVYYRKYHELPTWGKKTDTVPEHHWKWSKDLFIHFQVGVKTLVDFLICFCFLVTYLGFKY